MRKKAEKYMKKMKNRINKKVPRGYIRCDFFI